MVKSLVKTSINAIWVILVCLEISQVIAPSQAFGYALIAVYLGVLVIFRPMRPLYAAICKPDVNIPLERQASNKVNSFALLAIKIILMIACIVIIISGTIMYKFFFLRSLAVRIHLLCAYWTFMLSAIQLGLNIGITILPKLKEKFQIIIFYSSYIGSAVGIIFLIQSGLIVGLVKLNKNLILLSPMQVFFLLFGFVFLGIAFNHFIKRITKLKG